MPKKSAQDKKRSSMDRMKMEIANDFGVNLGAESSAKANGSVGGEMTRRLVQMAQDSSNSSCSNSSKSKNKSRKNK